jgi:hypothetical protein
MFNEHGWRGLAKVMMLSSRRWMLILKIFINLFAS